MAMIDVRGIDKGALLKALHDAASPRGMGWLERKDDEPDETWDELSKSDYHDYVFGRPLKVDIGGDLLDPYLYNRDHGEGTAARAVESLRAR